MNLSKIKARLERLNNGGGYGPSVWFKPEEGMQDLRILPDSKGEPFKDFFLHYNVGKEAGFLCPKRNYGEECPICEFASALFNESKENNDESARKLAISLFARQRFYSAVTIRGKEKDGSKWWSYGKKIYEQLLRLALNDDYGDITHIDTGIDLTMTYKKAQSPGAYPESTVDPKRFESKLCETKAEIDTMLEAIPVLNDHIIRKTGPEVQEALDKFIGEMDTSDEGTEKFGTKEAEVSKEKEPTSSKKPVKKKSAKSKVDEAFDKIGA